jgi:transcriptional regulator with XRE-family HTH domain
MDKRFKPLTSSEEMDVRRALLDDINANPGRPIPEVIRQVRTTLHLTITEYAKLCRVSPRGLQDIERGIKSPTLATVAKLLRPMGLRAGVVTRERAEAAEAAAAAAAKTKTPA